jgi:hypothetical protein
MDPDTQAQIARVIFEAIAAGQQVTDVQRLQLADWIMGREIRTWDDSTVYAYRDK